MARSSQLERNMRFQTKTLIALLSPLALFVLLPVSSASRSTPEDCYASYVSQVIASCTCDGQSCSVYITTNGTSGADCGACSFNVLTRVVCSSGASKCRVLVGDNSLGLTCEHFVDNEEVVETFCHDGTLSVRTTVTCNKCL